MKSFCESLMIELENQLKLNHLEINNPLQAAEHSVKITISTLEKLKTRCIKYKFQNKIEEIGFFRDTKPKFAARLIYFSEIYNVETNKPCGSKKTIRKYYNAGLVKLKTYFNENKEFYRYYRTENRSLDNKYFIRGQYDVKLTFDNFYYQADTRFSTSHDYKVARILANDMIKEFLENEIRKLSNKTILNQAHHTNTQKWTGSKVALIELIYALHTEKAFNNGASELKEVATFFESAFHIDLGQFNRTFLEIRARKSERTKFLNTLKEKLIRRMDDADEN